ncbi:hypothetical protein [Nocardia lasii]|uniref:Rpn family recombination-promoting nuclease/putative transposase n=1 Tax=Nocardia lasii TaxID=1616107 RepID=A0ABW1JVD3_9NOCA
MVSSSHEAMHGIFTHNAAAVAHAFRVLDLPFPTPVAVEQISVDLTSTTPVERRADTILRVTTADDEFLLVVEAQSSRDATRLAAWSYYVTFLHNKYGLPVVLVVVCHDKETATWASQPLKLAYRGWTSFALYPVVLGPHNVPAVTDPTEVLADLPLAALSAITHAREPEIGEILESIIVAFRRRGCDDETEFYAELIEQGISHTDAAQLWRDHMDTDLSFFRSESARRLRAQGREEGREEGIEEGVAQGVARSVLTVLTGRGIELSAAQRELLVATDDLDQLNIWLLQAVTATRAGELFD